MCVCVCVCVCVYIYIYIYMYIYTIHILIYMHIHIYNIYIYMALLKYMYLIYMWHYIFMSYIWHYIFILYIHIHAQLLSHIWLFATPQTVACQALLSMGPSSKHPWTGCISFSRASSGPRDGTRSSCIVRWIPYELYHLENVYLIWQ